MSSFEGRSGDDPGRRRANLSARGWARRLAMQAVYQQKVAGLELDEVVVEFQQDESFVKADANYFMRLMHGGAEHIAEIAEQIGEITGYDFELVDPVERAILLNAAYEILFVSEVDKAVAITEAVRLAKQFGAGGGYRLVNGVLDKLNA